MRLEGKVALVTGAAGGIGAATALLFAREGARVTLADILEETGEAALEEIRASGAEGQFAKLDVTDEASWQDAVAVSVSRFGRLDILVNNAGIQISRPSFEEVTLDDWERVMAVNATGAFLGARTVTPTMRSQRSGSIVNIASISGLVGISASAGYAASKGSVRIFTRYLAIQLAKYGVRANSIYPGVIDSPLTARSLADPSNRERAIARHPIGRIGRPEDVAYGALYLASDEAAWVTGAELVIDGGFTAQ